MIMKAKNLTRQPSNYWVTSYLINPHRCCPYCIHEELQAHKNFWPFNIYCCFPCNSDISMCCKSRFCVYFFLSLCFGLHNLLRNKIWI